MTDIELDDISKLILVYLINYKRNIAPVDKIALTGFDKLKQKLETKGLEKLSKDERKEYNAARFQVYTLSRRVAEAKPIPKSVEDISKAVKTDDISDITSRLSYLSKLSMIEESNSGYVIAERYR